MKTHNFTLVLFLFAASILISSCDTDDANENLLDENGLSHDINDFVPKEILEILDSLEMPINKGGKPPQIIGEYIISPLTLKSSTRSDDVIGEEYVDIKVKLSSQNNDELTINVIESYNNAEGTAKGSFIVGNGNKFTIFTRLLIYDPEKNDSSLTARIYSGDFTEKGIEDLYYSLVMVDDYGDPNNRYIEIGDARVFFDSDSISERNDINKSIVISAKLNDRKLLPGCVNN